MLGAGASRRGCAEERSARGWAMTSRGERDDVGRRVAASGAGSGWSGPVQGGLGRSGPVWVVQGRSGRWWAGSGGPDLFRFGWAAQVVWTGRGRAGLDRLGSDSAWEGTGPAWLGSACAVCPGQGRISRFELTQPVRVEWGTVDVTRQMPGSTARVTTQGTGLTND